MANYIITDNGQGEIAVYDDVVEKTAARTYHVYKDIDRRNYPYAEFFKRVFYEDKNNTISSISIDTNPIMIKCVIYLKQITIQKHQHLI